MQVKRTPSEGAKDSCFDSLLVILPQSYSAFLLLFLLFQLSSPLLLRSRRHGSQVLPLLLGEWRQGQPASTTGCDPLVGRTHGRAEARKPTAATCVGGH